MILHLANFGLTQADVLCTKKFCQDLSGIQGLFTRSPRLANQQTHTTPAAEAREKAKAEPPAIKLVS